MTSSLVISPNKSVEDNAGERFRFVHGVLAFILFCKAEENIWVERREPDEHAVGLVFLARKLIQASCAARMKATESLKVVFGSG